jgi:hypothetical protein
MVLDEAIEAAGNSCARLGCLGTRPQLLSTDSEAVSFLGNRQARQKGAREDQTRGQERGEQEKGESGRPQHELEARDGPTWNQDEETGRAPESGYFFFRSRRDEEEQLWTRVVQGRQLLCSLWPPLRLGADEGQRQWLAYV